MMQRTSTRWHPAALIAGVLVGLLDFAHPGWALEEYSEDAVKAAFLLRFAEYVDWPAETLAAGKFTVVVLGADAIAANLQRLHPGYVIKNLPTQVRAVRSIQEVGDPQILYVGPGQPSAVRAAVARLGARPVLLVTDEEQNLDAAGVLNFVLIDQRVRFEVSLPAAQRSGLIISSELLSVAYRVLSGGRRVTSTAGDPAMQDALAGAAPRAQPGDPGETPAGGGS